MWMCYSAESWPKAVNKLSAVERLACEFSALEQDAAHEAVYGMGGLFSEEYCHELEKRYNTGAKLCRKYIDGTMCLECLVKQLTAENLKDFVPQIARFLPDYMSEESSSSDSEETARPRKRSVEREGEAEEMEKKRRLAVQT